MSSQSNEKDARLDALVCDLRHPLADVSASEAALVEYVRERMAQAWDEGRKHGMDEDLCRFDLNPYRATSPEQHVHEWRYFASASGVSPVAEKCDGCGEFRVTSPGSQSPQ